MMGGKLVRPCWREVEHGNTSCCSRLTSYLFLCVSMPRINRSRSRDDGGHSLFLWLLGPTRQRFVVYSQQVCLQQNQLAGATAEGQQEEEKLQHLSRPTTRVQKTRPRSRAYHARAGKAEDNHLLLTCL